MADVTDLGRKPRRRRKRKKKKKPQAGSPPAAAPPAAPPPAGPTQFKHVLGYQDPGDGLVREVAEYRPVPQDPASVPPRPLPSPQNPAAPQSGRPFGVYSGPFGRVQAKRLLDRAGFGPLPGQALALSEMGLERAVHYLTRLPNALSFQGAGPVDDDGNAIAPNDIWGHDHLWWLDRMVRSNHQLVERMALVFHDWFATSLAGVDKRSQMIAQSHLFRDGCFGSFLDLTTNVTKDPAMLQWLNGNDNRRGAPNENYARELMELFTLGADRNAYSEFDIREAARALTGWRNDWSSSLGTHNFRFDANRHDNGLKRIFAGGTGTESSPYNLHPPTNWNWNDVPRLCVQHPLHASFFVQKLWSYFIPTPPSADTQAALESLYKTNGYAIRPVLEAILMHPDLYLGPPMVKPPVVFLAGMLRATGRTIDTEAWAWLCEQMGQMLFMPPNVAGWDDNRWLDTSRMRARWLTVTYVLETEWFDPWGEADYDAAEGAEPALEKSLATWDYPPLRVEHHNELLSFSQNPWESGLNAGWQQSPKRAMRRNALQHLIAISPDMLLS